MTELRRVVGYGRVSTHEQAASGAGMAAQRQAVEAACAARGWTLVTFHEDAGASGKSLRDRPGLDAALDEVAAGEVDGIVVAKLDRLSRSLPDAHGLIHRALRESWALVALDLGVDTSTASGRLVANVIASVAEWEREAIGERTRAALAARKAQGIKLGRPRRVAPDVVERIKSQRADGWSLRAICDGLMSEGTPAPEGGDRWWPAGVKRLAEAGS